MLTDCSDGNNANFAQTPAARTALHPDSRLPASPWSFEDYGSRLGQSHRNQPVDRTRLVTVHNFYFVNHGNYHAR